MPFLPKSFRSETLQDFLFVLLFVAVRSFTADSSLLQPTRGVNSTPHTSHFLVFLRTYYTHMRGSSLACAHHIPCVILMRSCGCFDSLRLLHFPLFAVHLLSYHPVFSSWPSTSSSTMWWTHSLCTQANEDPGTFAECDHLTFFLRFWLARRGPEKPKIGEKISRTRPGRSENA